MILFNKKKIEDLECEVKYLKGRLENYRDQYWELWHQLRAVTDYFNIDVVKVHTHHAVKPRT